MTAPMLQRDLWRGRRVAVTGHTGFKGGWLATWLLDLSCEVFGYALPPEGAETFFERVGLASKMSSTFADIRDASRVARFLEETAPEIIFHLAAQPLVRRSYREPAATFETNVMGTVNLLEAVRRQASVRAVVVVTSDKCYENREWLWPYREDEALGGRDPYSASKACEELVAAAYRHSFLGPEGHRDPPVALATARAGNVIGGGDFAEDRIVPDAVRALSKGDAVVVRNPHAVRPWQHVLDSLGGYLRLAERLTGDGPRGPQGEPWAGAWNFGPDPSDAVSVRELADQIVGEWGRGCWRDASRPGEPHEAALLTLDSSRAKRVLGWRPRLRLPEAIALTIGWYKAALDAGATDMLELTRRQIRAVEGLGPGAQV